MSKIYYAAKCALVAMSILGWSITATAFDFGVGEGCSAIGGVDATALGNGDTFVGTIGATAVSGFNPAGKPAGNSDADPFTDSLEECINDSLIGYCTTLAGDDSAVISVEPGQTLGRNGNRQLFTVTFLDVSGCGVSQCSDQEDNDGDTFVDYPADPECADYDDDDESGATDLVGE